jgi:hypothetical protein
LISFLQQSTAKLIDLSKRHGGDVPATDLTWPAAELLRQKEATGRLRGALDKLQQSALNAAIAGEPGGMKVADGRVFARPELSRALAEKQMTKGQGVLVAKLTVPRKLASAVNMPSQTKVQLNGDEWANLVRFLGP